MSDESTISVSVCVHYSDSCSAVRHESQCPSQDEFAAHMGCLFADCLHSVGVARSYLVLAYAIAELADREEVDPASQCPSPMPIIEAADNLKQIWREHDEKMRAKSEQSRKDN